MSPGARSIGRAALAAAIVIAAAAAATAQTAPTGLRGPELAAPPPPASPARAQKPPAAAAPGPAPSSPATLAAIGDSPPVDLDQDPAPRFTLDPAPRISGLSPAPGGAQCRTSCAADRYLCRSQEQPERCDSVWSQCVAACPDASPDAL